MDTNGSKGSTTDCTELQHHCVYTQTPPSPPKPTIPSAPPPERNSRINTFCIHHLHQELLRWHETRRQPGDKGVDPVGQKECRTHGYSLG
ncbi:hypothetical protein JZ751_019801 [Albula glossodonta]|uniref:Uncharacterized protein n=1 Tax=Albula glossodonta TaxID=121402 RepID=A0A8T2NXC1_9TELE|nr:hypothetical protein JZ751_019801 [Albula glossodonta]